MTAPDVALEPPQGSLTDDTTCDESEEEQEGPPEVTWEDVKQQLRLESTRLKHMLKLFEAQYEISSAVDAFSHIKDFLGVYMISSFDLAAFRESLGREPLAAEKCLDEAYLQIAASDLAAGPELMLRLAMTVARAYGLRMEDWEDINEACSEALNIVPACHHLQARLPMATLDSARRIRFLEGDSDAALTSESALPAVAEEKEQATDAAETAEGVPALVEVEEKEHASGLPKDEQLAAAAPETTTADADDAVKRGGNAEEELGAGADATTNPWKSVAGQHHFQQAHKGLPWDQVELLTAHDGSVTKCFAGAFRVENVSEVEGTGIVLVALEAVRMAAPPCCDYPEKDISAEDSIFWEVDKGLAPLLLKGVIIEGDWYEMNNEICFLGAVNSVAPRWILT